MAKKQIDPQMRDQLREGFPSEAYSAIENKPYLTTLKAIYVTERLNNVFGIGRWTIEFEIIERTADYITVQGEFKSLDFDIILPKQFGGHKTTGKGTEIADGYKSAVTDCQSKIPSYLEIGIEMFKGKISVPKTIPLYGKPEYKKPQQKKAPARKQQPILKVVLVEESKYFDQAVEALAGGKATMEELRNFLEITPIMEKKLDKCAGDLVADRYYQEQRNLQDQKYSMYSNG